jgi:ArsR family transcriptional regulator, virulence genes transcriptional regulator
MKRERERSRCNFVEPASRLMKTMGNRHRLMILFVLLQGEFAVGVLNAKVGLSPSSTSQHLAILRREGLVKSRREAQTIYYSLATSSVRALLARALDDFGDLGSTD